MTTTGELLESRAIHRVRRRLIPFLAVMYFVAYLDRVNVAFAALQMNAALGFSPSTYGKGAGIFFRVLNTPERIDVIEKMGHLDREDADFLRDAASFYRAIDHGQRVSTGHAEGSLPTARAQFEVLTNLVKRWTPEHLHQQRLDATLHDIRRRTREFFRHVFA